MEKHTGYILVNLTILFSRRADQAARCLKENQSYGILYDVIWCCNVTHTSNNDPEDSNCIATCLTIENRSAQGKSARKKK